LQSLDKLYLDSDRSGKILETFVFNELSTQIEVVSGYTFYHYRDRENREIDFIIENDNGDILCIEIKAGMIVAKEDFKHIKWFRENLVKDKKSIGVVLYSGENSVSFGKNLFAIPISILWN
jgi:predicted AAA+ superfamily ATPase